MHSNSETLFEKSLALVPGGVHSPVRSFKGMQLTPRFFKKAYGPYFEEVNGKQYVDFCMSFGPMILGHKNSLVEKELKNALENGWSFGACEPYSLMLAEFITNKIGFTEQIRFVNSGTEAVMTAIRLARGYTEKDKIIKFNGCYHGHADNMLIKAGSGLAGTPSASSKGVPVGVANDTIVCDLNNLDEVNLAFNKFKGQIAAVIIEPLPANNGLLIQTNEFLTQLRELCTKNEALLIFDEVISGFRVGFGGMAKRTHITPDLVTYGKVIGGGLPVGAISGPKKIMCKLAPLGDVYQAGTLSANPLAMVGGLTTLKQMTDDHYEKINMYTNQIVDLFKAWLKKTNRSDVHIIHQDSLFWFAPTSKTIRSLNDIPTNLTEKFNSMFYELLDLGVYLAPNAYEVGFVSLAHDESLIKDLKARLKI